MCVLWLESCIVRHAHTYKGEKYLARRLEEVNNTASWNALYLNNDTVMKVISEKLGVKTSDILDVESGNMAVRVALAETEVLEDTKKWLESQNVQIDVLEVRFLLYFNYRILGCCAWRTGSAKRQNHSGEESSLYCRSRRIAFALLAVRRSPAACVARVSVRIGLAVVSVV